MAKKKSTATGTSAGNEVVMQAQATKPRIEVVVDLWPGHDNRGLYISSIKSDVPVPWGQTAVVIVVDGNTGETVDATLAVRQPGQRDVRVVDARVVNAFNQCLHAVTGAVDVTVVARVDAKTMLSLAEVYHADAFAKQLEELRKVINGILFGDAGGFVTLGEMQNVVTPEMPRQEEKVTVVEEMPAGASVDAALTEDYSAPFDDDTPILSFIESKEAATAEETAVTGKRKRGKAKQQPEVAVVEEPVEFEQVEEEPVELEEVTEEETSDAGTEEVEFDEQTQFLLSDGEIANKDEFDEETVDNGDGTTTTVYTRGGLAYILEDAPVDAGVSQWLTEVQYSDDEADDATDDEADETEEEAVEEEDVADDDGYETVVAGDEDDDTAEILGEEVTLTEAQSATYDAFMAKVDGYDVPNLYSIAKRYNVKSNAMELAYKKADRAAMLVAISNAFIDKLLSSPSK